MSINMAKIYTALKLLPAAT